MIEHLYLGRVDYGEALRLQAEMAGLRQQGRVENLLLLLEHPPVLTLGRNAKRENILASDELLAARSVTLHEINRGGDVTYHGPGQLIGYPIFDLRSLRNPTTGARLGPVDFVRLIEEALIGLCGEFGLQAGRICGLTGVWCHVRRGGVLDERCCGASGANQNQVQPEAKIAAIGIHVARGITTHGFALNVTTDLAQFALIHPCGITDRAVTSLAKEVSDAESLPGLESLAHRAARQFGRVFHEPVLAVESLTALRVRARPAADFPAEDTPLQVPAEIERLKHRAGRPVRA